MIVFSQPLLKDSIKYPVTGIDKNGVQVVTITKKQQHKINRNLLALKKYKGTSIKLATYTELLLSQIADYEKVIDKVDTTDSKVTLMLENRQAKILELEGQIKLHVDNTALTEQKYKVVKRRLIGWKVGTFVTIGVVVVAAIPITILILK